MIIREAGIPAVNVSDGHGPDYPAVRTDVIGMATMAAKYFGEKGLRNIAYVGHDNSFPSRSITRCFGDIANRTGLRFGSVALDEGASWLDDADRLGRGHAVSGRSWRAWTRRAGNAFAGRRGEEVPACRR